jgi:hypothetical protein
LVPFVPCVISIPHRPKSVIPHADPLPTEFVLGQLIDSIGEAIEEVMCAHDLLSRAAGLPESFNEAL